MICCQTRLLFAWVGWVGWVALFGARSLAWHSVWFSQSVPRTTAPEGWKSLDIRWGRGISGGTRLLSRPCLADTGRLGRPDQVATRRDLRGEGAVTRYRQQVMIDCVQAHSLDQTTFLGRETCCLWIPLDGQIPGARLLSPSPPSPLAPGREINRTVHSISSGGERNGLDIGRVAFLDEDPGRSTECRCGWLKMASLSLVCSSSERPNCSPHRHAPSECICQTRGKRRTSSKTVQSAPTAKLTNQAWT